MHYTQKRCKALYFFAALLAAAVLVLEIEYSGIGDSDFYWHIMLGKEICTTHTIPVNDTFSWLSQELGLTETAHSWLGSVIVYLFSCIFSNPIYGLLLFSFISAFVYALFMELAWGKILQDPFENCLFVVLLTAFLPICGRPMNFGLILFAASFFLLNDVYRNPDNKRCWLLPVISLLWANLHGGSLPILFAFNALFVLMSYLPNVNALGLINEREQQTKKARTYISLLITNVLAGLINPYGYKLYYYFFVTNNEATKKYVAEWQPAYLGNTVVFFCIALLFVIAAAHVKIRVVEFLPIVACLLLTCRYIRIASYLLIVMTPLIFRFVGVMVREQENKMWKNGGRLTMGFTGSAKYWTIAATAVCVAVACIYAPFFAKKPEKTLDRMDSTFVEELKALDAKRLYTSYNDGGFVIYHGMQSFVDSRADLFPADAIDASVQMGLAANTSERALQDNIEKYNFDAILLNRSESKTCIEMMDLLPDWQRAIENDSYIVYTPVSK